MNSPADGKGERDLVCRRMLAFASVAEHLAVPNDLSALGSQILASLRDDVEALAVYLAMEDHGLTLLLHAGCRQPPPERAADAATWAAETLLDDLRRRGAAPIKPAERGTTRSKP